MQRFSGIVQSILDSYLINQLNNRLKRVELQQTRAAQLISQAELSARVTNDKFRRQSFVLEQSFRSYNSFPDYYVNLLKGDRANDSVRFACSILFWCNFRVLKLGELDKIQALLATLSRCETLQYLSYKCRATKARRDLILLEQLDRLCAEEERARCSKNLEDNQLRLNQQQMLKFLRDRKARVLALLVEVDAVIDLSPPMIPVLSLDQALDHLKIYKQAGEISLDNQVRLLKEAYSHLILRLMPDVNSDVLLSGTDGLKIAAEFSDMRALAHLCLEKFESVFLHGADRAKQRATWHDYVKSEIMLAATAKDAPADITSVNVSAADTTTVEEGAADTLTPDQTRVGTFTTNTTTDDTTCD